MESVFRAVVTYLILLVLFRISGKRTLSKSSPFELVLLLIISETTQEVLVDTDYSATNMVILVITLISMDILFSLLKYKFDFFADIIEGKPVLLVADGQIQKRNLKKSRVKEDDLLNVARSLRGSGTMEEIKHAILETDGSISVILYK